MNYSTWRRKLIQAEYDYARRGELLITSEEFVYAFTAPHGSEFNDWKLARDIVSLRIIEELHQSGEWSPDDEPLVFDEDDDETE